MVNELGTGWVLEEEVSVETSNVNGKLAKRSTFNQNKITAFSTCLFYGFYIVK